MGKGHVLFFLDKGVWLQNRHKALFKRLTESFGYRITEIPPLDLSHWPEWAMNDWQPSEIDMEVNRERLRERMRCL
jgi:hypothetical protein